VQYYYGNKTPLSVLDEIEFWKHQEGEHTVVIRQIAGNLEENFVEELKEWEQAFAQTEAVAVRYIEAVIRSKREISHALLEKIRKFTVYAKNQSLSFVAFLNQLAAESEAIRNNPVAGAVINHIRRESEYLIGIITAALKYF
jgi:hypothetical protein